jgi:hypothetical protein
MDSRKFINIIAYIAVILIAILLALRYIFSTVIVVGVAVTDILTLSAEYLALAVTILSAFSFATTRRNNAYLVVLFLFVLAIALFTFVL